jgi:hypothetical protein
MESKFLLHWLFCLFFLIEACDVMDNTKVKVYNNSRDTVFCLLATEDNFNARTYSPLEQAKHFNGRDTILTKNNNILFPNDSSIFSSYDWRYSINSSKSKQLNVFIFRYSTLKSKTWDDIKRDTFYDRKISMTIDELNSNNWKIHYK